MVPCVNRWESAGAGLGTAGECARRLGRPAFAARRSRTGAMPGGSEDTLRPDASVSSNHYAVHLATPLGREPV